MVQRGGRENRDKTPSKDVLKEVEHIILKICSGIEKKPDVLLFIVLITSQRIKNSPRGS